MKEISYENAREMMEPGDLIAFGGYGSVSGFIKTATKSNVSHVGTILQTKVESLGGFYINQIIESMGKGKKGETGVVINRLSDHINHYDGDIWWLPLGDSQRNVFDEAAFFSFLLKQVGKKYDLPQAIGSAIDFIPENREDLNKLYCSEMVAAAYERVATIGEVNASEETPIDVCRYPIYGGCFQLKGILKDLL